MMFPDQEAAHLDFPVHEIELTEQDIQELLSIFQTPTTTTTTTSPHSSSVSPNSGSEGSIHAVYSENERKRRRMISNRESAKRSRWRKKRVVENLNEQLNKLQVENHELKNQFGSVVNQCHALWRENYRLNSESLALRARLADSCQVIAAMHAMQRFQ